MVTAPKTSQSTNMVSTVKVGTVIRSVCVSHNTAPSGTAYIAMVTARCQPDGPVTAGTLQNFEFNRYKNNLTVTIKRGTAVHRSGDAIFRQYRRPLATFSLSESLLRCLPKISAQISPDRWYVSD